jgi:hypothetical protein
MIVSDRFVGARSLLFAGALTAAGPGSAAIPRASTIQPAGDGRHVRASVVVGSARASRSPLFGRMADLKATVSRPT